MDDPLRMYLVVRRGAFDDLSTGGRLAAAAAVACLRRFGHDPAHAETIARWRDRPGKVVLRARGGQWEQVLAEPHVHAGDLDGAAVIALPPRRRSARADVLERLQAMSSELEPPPETDAPSPALAAMTYLVNPRIEMSSGKTLAQIAHAATIAASDGRFEDWVGAGCPGRVLRPTPRTFDALRDVPELAAEVVDAGLTEVAPGTVTVRALAPAGT